MSTRWTFTPTEFIVVWSTLDVSAYPYPLDVRPSGETTDDWAALQAVAAQRLTSRGVLRNGRLDADVEAALRTLARPKVSVDACGFFGDRDESVVRVLGAHAGGTAVVGVQLPGPSEHVGGDVIVQVVATDQLCAAVVRELPPAPQGTEPALRLAKSELERSSAETVNQPVTPTPSQRGRAQLGALTRGPFAGAGQFGMSDLAQLGGPVRTSELRWFDRVGDGRYLMSTDGAITVRGADPTVLIEALAAQLERLTRRSRHNVGA